MIHFYKLFFVCFLFFSANLFSQNIQYHLLEPTWNCAFENQSAPDYSQLLDHAVQIFKEFLMPGCVTSIENSYISLVDAERSKVTVETEYVMMIDANNVNDCKVTEFRALLKGENPSSLHRPEDNVEIFIIKINPWLIINGKRY